MKKFNRTTKIVISLSIGLIFLCIWLYIIDVEDFLAHISEINAFYLIPSIVFYLLSYFFRSLRLRWLLLKSKINISNFEDNKWTNNREKINVSIFKNYTYVLAGNFINYLIPIRAGEVAKSVFYKKYHNIRYADSLPSIFIDKLLDTFAILLILLLLPFTDIALTSTIKILIFSLTLIFLVGLSILTIVSMSKGLMIKILQNLFFFLPQKHVERINRFIKLFVEGLAIFKHNKRIFIPCILLTFIATLSDGMFFFMMFRAFAVSMSFIKILFGYTLIFLSYILPHPPAQIGSNELIMLLIFTVGFSLNENLVSAVMSLSHLLTATVIFITGSLSLLYSGNKIIDLFKK